MASNLEMERARKQQSLGVVPYQGSEPFIFVSYAHRDFDRVIPIVKALIDYGFRVWYDEGIDPGTEWDAYIADHVEGCYCMLSFLSQNYLDSRNCLDELSYARDLEKKQLFVYLESVNLPGRIALRFGRLQAIHQHTYLQPESFYKELFSAEVLVPTMHESAPQTTVPAVRKPDLQAISALFEYEQSGDFIIITKLKAKIIPVVTIPWGVVSIGKGTFRECTNLTDITIPDSVTSIGKEAFWGCTNLAGITIPGSVTSIDRCAFWGCSSLTSVTIEDGVTSIAGSAFEGCKSLVNITIPGSITSIADAAFEGCTSLVSITIPGSVTSIGMNAFLGCRDLTGIAIPDSVTSIGDSAFWNCHSLTSIEIPNSITSLGESAFWQCSSLTGITIPGSVTGIGEWTFCDCSSLANITIRDGVIRIDDNAFYGCTSLVSIIIPDSVTSIGAEAFLYCKNLTIRGNPGSYAEQYAKANGIPFEQL